MVSCAEFRAEILHCDLVVGRFATEREMERLMPKLLRRQMDCLGNIFDLGWKWPLALSNGAVMIGHSFHLSGHHIEHLHKNNHKSQVSVPIT